MLAVECCSTVEAMSSIEIADSQWRKICAFLKAHPGMYAVIPQERVQSVTVDDSTNTALFESFWAQLTPPDDAVSH